MDLGFVHKEEHWPESEDDGHDARDCPYSLSAESLETDKSKGKGKAKGDGKGGGTFFNAQAKSKGEG